MKLLIMLLIATAALNASRYIECPKCEGMAFLVKDGVEFVPFTRVYADDFLHIDGRPIVAGERVRCDICGNQSGQFFRIDKIKEIK